MAMASVDLHNEVVKLKPTASFRENFGLCKQGEFLYCLVEITLNKFKKSKLYMGRNN